MTLFANTARLQTTQKTTTRENGAGDGNYFANRLRPDAQRDRERSSKHRNVDCMDNLFGIWIISDTQACKSNITKVC